MRYNHWLAKRPIIDSDGTRCWYQNGLRHRDNDLPAIIQADGTQFWCRNDLYHRDNDLPAVFDPSTPGIFQWWENGQRVPKPPHNFK